MTSDFRSKFYTHYVSEFKQDFSHLNDNARIEYYAWHKHKLLPLFDGVDKKSKILEIGCGPGYILDFLSQNGFSNLLGIDISDEQVELARQRGCNARVYEAIDFLRQNTELFDVIVALDFIEHFYKDEILDIVKLITTSLAAGGCLILKTPNGEGLFPRQIIYGDFTHLTILTPTSLTQLLTPFGYGNFQFAETGPAPKNFKGKIRLLLWRGIKFFANVIRLIEAGKRQQVWTEAFFCRCDKILDGESDAATPR